MLEPEEMLMLHPCDGLGGDAWVEFKSMVAWDADERKRMSKFCRTFDGIIAEYEEDSGRVRDVGR